MLVFVFSILKCGFWIFNFARARLLCTQGMWRFERTRENSTLRVERRKWGNAASVKFAARDQSWSRDNLQSRSPSAKCCELYASLHDRFRLEVRILFHPMRTWKLAAWVTLIIDGMRVVGGTGEGVQAEGGAGVRGAAPVGSRGEAPAGGPGGGPLRLSRNELKMFHEQILSQNKAWFMKIRKQMTTANKNIKMILSASAFNSCMIEFSIPDFNETIIKNIISLFLSFLNTERREVVFRT